MTRTPADVVLQPRGRRARYGQAPIVAIVSQGFQDRGSDYTHPTVELRTLDSEGGYGLKAFCVRFQQHRRTPDIMYWRPGRGGFLTTRGGEWSAAYAPTIECSMENRKWIRRCLDLTGAADGRTYGDRRLKKGGDCELLRLIVGLQRSGVEVRIYSEHVRRTRERRAQERQGCRIDGCSGAAAAGDPEGLCSGHAGNRWAPRKNRQAA